MSVFVVFLLTVLISFAGSIHPGPVNMTVIRNAIQNDFKSALYVGLGGSLPECLYALIALFCLAFLRDHPETLYTLHSLVFPFFLLLALYYFLPRKKRPVGQTVSVQRSVSQGILLALFNPQLLPFWFASLLFIDGMVLVQTTSHQFAFVVGTATGAFALLSLYAWLASRNSHFINRLMVRLDPDKIMGLLFLFMAMMKLVS